MLMICSRSCSHNWPGRLATPGFLLHFSLSKKNILWDLLIFRILKLIESFLSIAFPAGVFMEGGGWDGAYRLLFHFFCFFLCSNKVFISRPSLSITPLVSVACIQFLGHPLGEGLL